MKEHPILFSGPMVRAILDGRKTQTRRVITPQPVRSLPHTKVVAGDIDMVHPLGWRWRDTFAIDTHFAEAIKGRCPYGQPGDRQTLVYYRATPRAGYRPVPDRSRMTYLHESSPLTEWYKSGWKPSIHMPRWASRITLEVTRVRVELVQDISGYDAKAEGIRVPECECEQCRTTSLMCPADQSAYVQEFMGLWDSINAKRGFGWDVNPWVWVVTFKAVQS